MEIAAPAPMEGLPRRQENRSGGGLFGAEIMMDRSSPSIPRGPEYGFATAVREPLVRLRRPKFEFERWDWDYFAWPHDRLDANLEMRDSDPEATLEADRKASESFLNRSTLQLERCVMDQDAQAQHAAALPCEQHDVNIATTDSGLEATLEADRKASEGFLNGSVLQQEGYAMEQYMQEQNAITLPRNQHSGNQGTRACNRKSALETDQKAIESLLSRSTLQPKRRKLDQHQHTHEQQKEPELRTPLLLDGRPVGRRSTRRRRGCAEANGILDHGRAMQGSWAC